MKTNLNTHKIFDDQLPTEQSFIEHDKPMTDGISQVFTSKRTSLGKATKKFNRMDPSPKVLPPVQT